MGFGKRKVFYKKCRQRWQPYCKQRWFATVGGSQCMQTTVCENTGESGDSGR
jgi:hypothetical protein